LELIDREARLGLEKRRAIYSADERFRYALHIEFGDDLFPGVSPSYVAYIGLNPSTATENEDDPTVRRCKERARRMGFGGMVMLNLYAFRDTDPRKLKEAGYPVGPANDRTVRAVCEEAGMVILAYGQLGEAERVKALLSVLEGIPCHCLGVTQSGRPKHPLYLSYDVKPVPYEFGAGDAVDRRDSGAARGELRVGEDDVVDGGGEQRVPGRGGDCHGDRGEGRFLWGSLPADESQAESGDVPSV
jgi:hypothetical protein